MLKGGFLSNPRVKAAWDGFTNIVTGLNTERDKTAFGDYTDDPLLTDHELERLFAFNDLAATIVSKRVEDALRDGFGLERKGGSQENDEQLADKIMEAFKALEGPRLVKRGGIMGQLFGGGGLILGVKGAGDLSTPLVDAKARSVEFLQDWDRQDLRPLKYYSDGSVEVYEWTRPSQNGMSWSSVPVHETRVMVFPGELTTNRMRTRNQGWDLSVLQRVLSALKSFDSMFASTDTMFADCSQAVFKLKGLIEALASSTGTGENDVMTRLMMMDRQRSSGKALILDAGDETGDGEESFEHQERSTLGTLADVIDKYYVRLAAAARYPLTVLLGMSPAGMDATGESDMILYFNTVDIYRKEVLEPRILRLVRMIASSLGDAKPEQWTLEWPELARPTPLDVATAENMRITGATALVTGKVVLPEELALSLKKLAPTLGLTVNRASRLKALKIALEELEKREMTGPEAEPEPAPGAAPATKMSERKTPSKAAGKQVG